ncbi:MAG: extracellular solute-binding protein [Lachnospiraceae bacterium]|nr:extracellular solute-binding protein [Lachnospiraceae bacterium]
MKKYKKVLVSLLVGAMVFSTVACGSSGSDAQQSSGGNDTAQSNTAEEEKQTEAAGAEGTGESVSGDLRMIFWDSNQEPGLVQMAEGFMKQNPDCKVTVETVPWDEYWTKLQAAAQGGDLPDVFVMHPDEVKNYAEGGMLMDLTDILNGDIANADNFPQYVVDDFKVGGGYYGIPKDIGTLGLFYNKDIFDAAGVEYPTADWTWDDMMDAAEKLTDPANGIYGIAADNNGQNFYWNLIWQNGGEVFDEETQLCTFDSPESIEAMEYAVSFVEKGYSPTPADLANLSADEYFESGKTAMNFAGSWMLTEYLNVDTLNFGVAELPAGKEKGVICSGMAFSVAANAKNPEAALKLVEYLGSEEAQTIEAQSGVAIPAYNGTQQPWIDQFDVDVSAFVTCAAYGHTSPGFTTSTSAAGSVLDEYMPQVFSLTMPVDEAMKTITEKINESLQ